MRYHQISLLLFLCTLPVLAFAQPRADKSYQPEIDHPSYSAADAPYIVIDEKHGNAHTRKARYLGFSRLLEADGYIVKSGKMSFDTKSLSGIDVLVIANATPTSKGVASAFDASEINALDSWVAGGGSLLLIADHSPFPLYADDLARAFGFRFVNGIAYGAKKKSGRHVFSVSNNGLNASAFASDEAYTQANASFTTFTGSAFTPPAEAINVLKFGTGSWISMVPNGKFSDVSASDKYPIEGLSQGALLEYDRGKVAVFGEAAGFTAQKNTKRRVGLHIKGAEGNEQFILALMRWLSKK